MTSRTFHGAKVLYFFELCKYYPAFFAFFCNFRRFLAESFVQIPLYRLFLGFLERYVGDFHIVELRVEIISIYRFFSIKS